MRAIWTYLVCVLLGTGLAAAEKTKPDATAGLEMLCEMAGIPDLSKAEPGTVRPSRPSALARQVWSLAQSRYELNSLSWKLGENPDGSLRVLLQGLYIVSLYPATDKDESRLAGKWRRQTLKAPVREARQEAKERLEEQEDEDRNWGPDLEAGRLLLQAAFLFAAGQREAANQLAATLLGGKHPERVIAGAYSAAADRQYETALLTLIGNGDRPAFVKALQGLRERFAKDWTGLVAMEHVLRTMQSAKEPPEAVAALGKEDRKLVNELMMGTAYDAPPDAAGWLFFAPEDLSRKPPLPALTRLLSKGVDAFPVLLALAEDPRPTTYITTETMQRTVEFFHGDDDDDVETEKGVQTELPHPMTGTELAQHILGALWENRNYRAEPEDPEESIEDARAWYQTHRGLSRPELAKKLLGEREGRSAAILYLLSRPLAEKDYAEIEEAIAKLDTEWQDEPLSRLVETRGEKARPAVERAIKKAEAGEEAEWRVPQLKTLLPAGEGDAETADAFWESLDKALEEEGNEVLYGLMPKIMPFAGNRAVVGGLLERAAKTKDQEHRQLLLMFLQTAASDVAGLTMNRGYHRTTWEDFDKAPEKPVETGGPVEADRIVRQPRMLKLDRKRYGAAWRELLPRQQPSASILSGGRDSGTAALWLFLRMYGPDDEAEAFGREHMERTALLRTLPGGIEKRLWRRVQILLNTPEAPLPPWPDPDTVKPERVAEIVAALAKLPAKGAREQALALPDEEHMALARALSEHEELANRLLVEQGWTLPNCQFVGDVPSPVRQALASFAGKRLSKELGKAILAASKKLVEQGHAFVAVFQAGPGLALRFEVGAIDPAAKPGTDAAAILKRFGRQVGGGKEPGVHMTLDTRSRQRAFWPVQNGKQPDPPAKDKNPDQTLAKEEDDLEDLIGGDDDESATEDLLQALDEAPENSLLEPRRSASLLIVGLDENACKRLKADQKKRDDR